MNLGAAVTYAAGTILTAAAALAFSAARPFADEVGDFLLLLLGPLALWRDFLHRGATPEGFVIVAVPTALIVMPMVGAIALRRRAFIILSSILWPAITFATFAILYV